MIREPDMVIVRAVPDPIPVEFSYDPCVYASWITPELMREVEEG